MTMQNHTFRYFDFSTNYYLQLLLRANFTCYSQPFVLSPFPHYTLQLLTAQLEINCLDDVSKWLDRTTAGGECRFVSVAGARQHCASKVLLPHVRLRHYSCMCVLCVFVCLCACERVCVCACVRVCVRACV